MKHFWFGELINSKKELEFKLSNLMERVEKGLSLKLKTSYFVDVCDSFARSLTNKEDSFQRLRNFLLEDGLDESEGEELLNEIAKFCRKDSLITKLTRELGTDDVQDLKRVDFKRNIFESWEPLGVVTHITPGNSMGLSFLALIEGLLAGNINLIKLSSRESSLTTELIEELLKYDSEKMIQNFICVLRISSSDQKILSSIFSISDGVSAWGGEAAIQTIREMIPSGIRFIPWGHKISLGLVTNSMMSNKEIIKKMALDCVAIDQQACSSPQTIFVESTDKDELDQFSQNLLREMEALKKDSAQSYLTLQDQAEITNISEVVRLEEVLGKTKLLEGKNKNCRVFVDYTSGLSISPLYGSIWIRPIKKDNLVRTLLPLRQYLQTCGLASGRDETGDWLSLLLKAGILRITNAGEMLESYEGEPHDGVYALTRLMKRVRCEHDQLSGQYRVSSLLSDSVKAGPIPDVEVMTKADFQALTPEPDKTKLYFRSGGSSGKPAISTFSYEDYHSQMQAAAEGLFAAGLEPEKDRVINLFFGGGLYGGFLSFHTILEKLGSVHFPMQAIEDYASVASTIVNNKIDTLIGMPSYMLGLFKDQSSILKEYKGIKKIFYGGEHLTIKQREWLKNEFGVKVLRAASYGSVDAGPLGFQCNELNGSIYHLNHTLHSLEILSIEKDNPVEAGQIGRLVFTSHKRNSLKITRYDVGDLGRGVSGDCPCGRKSVRFELLGRAGDVFRAAGTFLNYQRFSKLLNEELSYSGEFQVVIEKNADGLRDHMILNLESGVDSKLIRDELLKGYKDLEEAVLMENCLDFSINEVRTESFYRVSSSGKLRRVVDLR